jgi:hypothetical protein
MKISIELSGRTCVTTLSDKDSEEAILLYVKDLLRVLRPSALQPTENKWHDDSGDSGCSMSAAGY